MGYVASTKPRQAILSDDDLLAAVLALSPARRWRHFDRLVGRPEVAAIGFRVSERRLSPRPTAQRDREMTELHDRDKLTYADIGHIYNLKPRTVARACQRFRQRQSDNESLSPRCLPYDR